MEPRKTALRSALTSTLLFISASVSAQEIFEKVSVGAPILEVAADARAAGLGDAFVAVAEGPFATIWNPAGLASQPGVFVLPFAYRDLRVSRVESLTPVSIEPWYYTGAVSAGFHYFGFGITYSHYDPGTGDAIRDIFRSDIDVTQSALHLGAAFDFGAWLIRDRRLLASVGTTAKRADLGVRGVNGWELDAGTLLGYKLAARGVVLLPRLGVSVRNIIDGNFDLDGQPAVLFDRVTQFGASVDVVPPWRHGAATLVQAMLSFQSDAFFGDRTRKPIVRSGLELTALGLVTGRLGVRRDHDTRETFTDFGFGLGYSRLRIGARSLSLQFDFASSDDLERSEVYALSATLGM